MKAFSFENWEIDDSTKPFLFFVQSMQEMLFHYGHDSYKVPTLNFYFLCLEVLQSIQKVEDNIIDKGNLRPLLDELYEVFSNDLVAQKIYGDDFDVLFYSKDDKGEYSKGFSQLRKDIGNETSVKAIQRTISFLVNDMKIGDKYFETLKAEITKVLYSVSFDIDAEYRLSMLSRTFLTELINRGYNQEYIYSEIIKRYYSLDVKITDVSLEVEYLWGLFSFETKRYNVIVPIKQKDVKNLLERFKFINVTDNNERLFGKAFHWIASIEVEALEPESARNDAVSLISTVVSMKQYNSHTIKAFEANNVLVKETETNEETYLSTPVGLLSRGRTRSEEQSYVRIEEMLQRIHIIGEKFFTAINLHASAMESKNVSNQLLNLWTIVEVLVAVEKRNNHNKITQITNTLTTVLNASYIKSIIEQLLLDLKHYCAGFSDYLSRIDKGENEYEKLIAMLICDEFLQVKMELINELTCYPLLRWRIEYYSKQFSNRVSLKNFLFKHRKRLEWQIVRIYRNRNMIIHDGSHFPYIDLIVQNLHFYVDSLIDTINYYIGRGYRSLDVIYRLLGNNEFIYYEILDKKDNNQALPIRDDFPIVVLGNSYIP